MMSSLQQCSLQAKAASRVIRNLDLSTRNRVLEQFAQTLELNSKQLIQENRQDMEDAATHGMNPSMLDRLMIDEARIHQMAQGIRQVAQLPDPLNRILEARTLKSGLRMKKISTAFGVIGIIYESRPNVTADCAALCFKAGSAVILKGGKESWHSSLYITSLFRNVLQANQLPEDAVQLADHPGHEEVQTWIEDRNSMDLLLPRGSRNLIRSVVDHAKVPVIETGAGICHIYVDRDADLDMAQSIVLNAKTSHPSVCNAMETLLVHEQIAETFVPKIVTALNSHGVHPIYGNGAAVNIDQRIMPASSDSFDTEYDDLIMNLAVVKDIEEAVNHIEAHSTHHSESIITKDQAAADWFMNHVDSACVYHNASTRFTDGFEYGLGAEIGISTQKLHARGPMALNEITTYTYHVEGDGNIRL